MDTSMANSSVVRSSGGNLKATAVVDLHDHAVDLVAEVVSALLPSGAVVVHGGEAAQGADLGVDREAERGEVVEGLGVTIEGRPPLQLAELVRPQGQPAGGGLGRVLLAE
jgi:hypothetical protein